MSDHLRHGTYDGYRNHGCRCDVCTHAFADYMRENFSRRAATAPCSVEGCDRGLYSRGLCRAHYERQRTGRPIDSPVRSYADSRRGFQPSKRRLA